MKIPDGKNSATVENTFTEDGRYLAKDQERISHGHFGVAKWSENNNVLVQDGSTTLLQWVVRISFPDNNDDLIRLTYTDTMSMAHGDQEKDGLHYTTPELLKKDLTSVLVEIRSLFVGYSDLSAATGSLFAALRDGSSPARSVNRMDSAMRPMAAVIGREALISVVERTWWMILLPGIRMSRAAVMPMMPANAPVMNVSALKTSVMLCLLAPSALRMPISFRLSSTEM